MCTADSRAMGHGQNLILVDEPPYGDNRVSAAVAELGGDVRFLDITERAKHGPVRQAAIEVRTLAWMLTGMLGAFARMRKLSPRLGGRLSRNWFTGLAGVKKGLQRALAASHEVRAHCLALGKAGSPTVVYANDLYCAVAATIALRKNRDGVTFIYDAHELEIHRNRKAGWFRVLIEHELEARALRSAEELRVVNAAIKDVMAEWYRLPSRVEVRYNDHYKHWPVALPGAVGTVAIVYVGKGVRGRMLEMLSGIGRAPGIQVFAYLLGTPVPEQIDASRWILGPIEYEDHLREVVATRRSMMWCCLENVSLSYELATPNKFFQALAVGVPVIASDGTYLADIVERYDVGLVYRGQSPDQIAALVSTERFPRWVENVIQLRNALRARTVEL